MRTATLLLVAALAFAPATAAQKIAPQAPALSPADRAALVQQHPEIGTCETGIASADLEGGDVRARLYNTGTLFWRSQDNVYTVPKDGDAQALFLQSFWIGGLDTDGDLLFSGSDYGPYELWPGPLSSTGTPPKDCRPFDRIFAVSRDDIAAYDASGALTDDLRDWPFRLGAPVIDGDGDPNNYDLAAGDRPALEGSMIAWWVMNDVGNVKTHSQTDPIGLEVQVTAHAYDEDPNVADPTDPTRTVYPTVTVYDYVLIHKGDESLTDVRAGFFLDMDVGDPQDDFIGSDTLLHLGYTYNGADMDGDYGDRPPAVGLTFLETPDRPEGEGRLDTFMEISGDPEQGPENQVYRYMQGIWPDGSPITVGGNGFGGSEPTGFMYAGAAEARAFWSEENVDGAGTRNTPAERTFVTSSGDFDFEPGDEKRLRVALVWARGSNRLGSVAVLKDHVAYVRETQAGRAAQLPPTDAPSLAPTLLAVANRSLGVTREPELRWTDVPGAVSYRIEISPESGSPTDAIVATTAEPRFQAPPLGASQAYVWRVRAEGDLGSGPWSQVFTFTTNDVYAGTPGSITGFLAVANAAGPIVPPLGAAADYNGFPAPEGWRERAGEQQVGAGVWFIHTGDNGSRASYEAFVERALRNGFGVLVPDDFEMRFTRACYDAWIQVTGTQAAPAVDPYAYLDGLPGSAPDGACWAYDRFGVGDPDQNFEPVIVPFELWNTGSGTPDDPSDDVRMIPAVIDWDGDGFDMQVFDHSVSTATDDPESDWVYWLNPCDPDCTDDSDVPGEAGYLRWRDNILSKPVGTAGQTELTGSELIARMVLVNWNGGDVAADPFVIDQDMPEPGTVFRITTPNPVLDLVADLSPINAVPAQAGSGSGRITIGYAAGAWALDGSGTLGGVQAVSLCPDGSPPGSPDCAALDFDASASTFTVPAATNTDLGFGPTASTYAVYVTTGTGAMIGGTGREATNRAPGAVGNLAPAGLLDESAEVLDVTFDEATDPDGHPVRYRWQVSTEAAFPRGATVTEIAARGSHRIPIARLDSLLRAQGVDVGGTAPLYHRIAATDGSAVTYSEVLTLTRQVAASVEGGELPVAFALGGVYPNPVASRATLALDAPRASDVRLTVFDLLGRRVVRQRSQVGAGYGQRLALEVGTLASGVYLYRVEADGESGGGWTGTGRFVVAR